MEWTEVVFTVESRYAEDAAAIAGEYATGGVYIEDYSTFDNDIKMFGPVEIIDDALLTADRTRAKIHIYLEKEEQAAGALSAVKGRLENLGISAETDSSAVRDEDWANNWKAFFKPANVGKSLVLCPTWEYDRFISENPDIEKKKKILRIDPGMAFGSGKHDTTRLCMEMIEQYIKPGDKVLDVGCGSGILAVSALLLGASEAKGVDIDPLAVKVAEENAGINGVGDRFSASCGNLAEAVSGSFDLICANIVADIILLLMPDAKNLLSDDGVFIMSGIIDTRLRDVEKGISENGFTVVSKRLEEGWCALAVKK